MTWAGKILRVNLTQGTIKSEPLNMQWAREYIGQRGLATLCIGGGQGVAMIVERCE